MHRTVTDLVLDAVQNALEAGSTLVVLDYRESAGNDLEIFVADNGRGMTEEETRKALDPFRTDGSKHPGRRVGLGLPFIRQAAESSGGKFEIDSRPGEGTSVYACFRTDHPDCPPAGDVAELFSECMIFGGTYEMAVNRWKGPNKYTVTRGEISDALGSLNDAGAIALLKKYVRGLEDGLVTGNAGEEESHGKTHTG